MRLDIGKAKASRPRDGFIPNPKLKLLDQVSEVMRFKRQVERARRPERLPTVLTQEEAQRVLSAMSGTHQLMARLLYGTGLRLMECVRLRVKDVDFGQNQVVVREGKGFKDRVTVLPERLKQPVAEHLKRVKLLHEKDLEAGYGRVYLPDALNQQE